MTLERILTVAQTAPQSFQTTEFDLPESTVGILLLFVGLFALFGVTVRTSLRDSRFLHGGWRATLLSLRTLVLILVLVVFLNPRQRTQTTQIQKSRVGILIDTSLSMAFPAGEQQPGSEQKEGVATETRAEAVQKTLVDSRLLDKLSRTHSVSVYGFDSTLVGPQAVVSDADTSFVASDARTEGSTDAVSTTPGTADDQVARLDLTQDEKLSVEETTARWEDILQPMGAETRLGEALHQLIGQLSGRTLSGVVVLTDGASNAGLDVEVARLRAQRSETKLITVGVGSNQPQVNLRLAGMQSPSDVHRGDPFDVSVTVLGNGLSEQSGSISLYQQSAGSDGKDRRKVDEKPFEFATDDVCIHAAATDAFPDLIDNQEIDFRKRQLRQPGRSDFE